MSKLATGEISMSYESHFAGNPEDRFCRDEAVLCP